MELAREIETTIYDFNLNNMPPRRTAKRIVALINKYNKEHQTAEVSPSNSSDLLCCPCCGGTDIGEKGPYDARHDMRHYAYGCHTCGVVALTMISFGEAKKRFARRAI